MSNEIASLLQEAVASGPDGASPAALLVGYSGGLDSTVLLHALAMAHPGKVRAIHVHHGLHPEADGWAIHCERTCDALGVPLVVARVDVADIAAGPEAAARAARHTAFHAHLHEGEWLALGHHRDDQAETFLLRALRGSGPDGLAAMRPWRRFGAGTLWRPLLGIGRDALLAYARAHGLAWIDDPSNDDDAFDRNFLRNGVMPLLRKRWPQADAVFARSAALCESAHALLADNDLADLERVRGGDASARLLSIEALLRLPQGRRARVLRLWVHTLGLPPLPHDGIRRIEAEVLAGGHDAQPRYDWSVARIQRWRRLLHAGSRQLSFPPGWMRLWDGRMPLLLPEGSRLSLSGGSGFRQPVMVRPRLGGERIDLPFRSHSHALKHVLQEHSMPPWDRQRLPLLLDPADGTVLAAGDRIRSRHFQRWPIDANASLHWQLT